MHTAENQMNAIHDVSELQARFKEQLDKAVVVQKQIKELQQILENHRFKAGCSIVEHFNAAQLGDMIFWFDEHLKIRTGIIISILHESYDDVKQIFWLDTQQPSWDLTV